MYDPTPTANTVYHFHQPPEHTVNRERPCCSPLLLPARRLPHLRSVVPHAVSLRCTHAHARTDTQGYRQSVSASRSAFEGPQRHALRPTHTARPTRPTNPTRPIHRTGPRPPTCIKVSSRRRASAWRRQGRPRMSWGGAGGGGGGAGRAGREGRVRKGDSGLPRA